METGAHVALTPESSLPHPPSSPRHSRESGNPEVGRRAQASSAPPNLDSGFRRNDGGTRMTETGVGRYRHGSAYRT